MGKEKSSIDFRYISLKGFTEVQWYVALIGVLAILLIGWASIMSLLGFGVSLSNIIYIHNFMFVWFFDIVICAVPFLFLYIQNYKKIKLDALQNEVSDLKSQIDTSIVIAGKIGAGQQIDVKQDANSELQRTLMTLGNNLLNTKEKERQLSWVAKGKETVSDIVRVNNKTEELAVEALQGIVKYYEAAQGAFYLLENDGQTLTTVTQYAYNRRRYEQTSIKVGYGLVGAVAYEKKLIYRTEIPEDYFTITSGLLNDQKPKSLLLIPLLNEDSLLQGVIELSFLRNKLPQHYLTLAEEICSIVGSTIFNLKINQLTERLLKESQEMTSTLKKNEEQLHQNAQEMMIAQENLEASNKELDAKTEAVRKVLEAFDTVTGVNFSTDKKVCDEYWAIRSGIFPMVGGMRKQSTTCLIEDIAFHIEDLPQATADLSDLLDRHGYDDSCIYGHALDGNFHFIINQAFDSDAEVARYEAMIRDVAKMVVEKYDGSLKAEHGTGRNMAPFVSYEWGEKAWNVMRRLKDIFDPEGILNPGVIFNDDPECFIKGFKALPLLKAGEGAPEEAVEAFERINKCIECGFCEVNCVSCGFTLSSRQPIVIQREIERLRQRNHAAARGRQRSRKAEEAGEAVCLLRNGHLRRRRSLLDLLPYEDQCRRPDTRAAQDRSRDAAPQGLDPGRGALRRREERAEIHARLRTDGTQGAG